MEMRISSGSNISKEGQLDAVMLYADTMLLSFYPCSSRELMNIQLLSEIMNLNIVLNNDSEHASVFCYCLPLK